MYDPVLVPTDGSDHAVRAGEHALALARAFDADLHVLGVADLQAAAGLFAAGGVDDAFVARVEDGAREAVETTLAALDDPPATTAVVEGRPARTILDYAAEVDAGLVAMGSHGHRGVRRVLSGSTTEAVLRRSEVPVLAARATERSAEPAYDDVLVPTDGSDHAEAATDHAVAVAEQTGARVHALSAVDAAAVVGATEFGPPAGTVRSLERAARDAAEAVVDRAAATGVEGIAEVRTGRPGEAILDYAAEEAVDLIAMGTAGLTGLDRVVLGSTTDRVVRRSEVPVLGVRA